MYSCDKEPELVPEFVHFSNFIGQFDECRNKHDTLQASDIYTIVVKNGLTSSFPNVAISLRIYWCLMITDATGERSFSKLKLIKNAHRLTMGQDQLNWLSFMSIENDVLNNVQFTDILEKLVSRKLPKANVWIIIVVSILKINLYFLEFRLLFMLKILQGLTVTVSKQ